MSERETQNDLPTANARVIDDLRKSLEGLAAQLPVELEPAPVYTAHVRVAEAEEE